MSTNTLIHSLVIPGAHPDPWNKREAFIPRQDFGKGLVHDFPWFFKGESNVHVKKIKDICIWLSRCKYVLDEVLFLEEDFWQHPVTFEATRKGDCEDHALWAWRKLVELGVHAELVAGKAKLNDEHHSGDATGHCWVIFRRNGGKWRVMECTAKNRDKLILTPEETAKTHFPEVSVDGNFKKYRFPKNK